MKHLIIWTFKIFVLLFFVSPAIFLLIITATLLWDGRFIDVGDKIKDYVLIDKKDNEQN